MSEVLAELDRLLAARLQDGDPESSYVARLRREGLDQMLRKLAEEATEMLLAAKAAEHAPEALEQLVHETADLWFHSLVVLAHLQADSTLVLKELQRRLHTSGLAEKAARPQAR